MSGGRKGGLENTLTEVTGGHDDDDNDDVKQAETYDLSPAFSSVSSSRLLDLLTVCRTWSTTSDP